jgi:hypothetical protein
MEGGLMESAKGEARAETVAAAKKGLQDLLVDVQSGRINPTRIVIDYQGPDGGFGYATPAADAATVGLLALAQSAMCKNLIGGPRHDAERDAN